MWSTAVFVWVDERHSTWHQQVTRSGVAPIVLIQVNNSAIVPSLLFFLILRLDDGRCLNGALLKELEAFAAL